MKKPPSQYRNILCVRIDRIGDMLITTPALRALRQNCPEARIDMIASTGNAAVLKNNKDLNNVYVFDKKSLANWFFFLRTLPGKRYDLVLVFNGASLTTAILAKFTLCGEIYAVSNKRRGFFYTEILEEPENMHKTERQLTFLRHLGFDASSVDMHFTVTPEIMAKIAAQYPRKPGLARIGVFIGNSKKALTRWPAPKFRELTERLLENAVEVYIIAGAGDVELLDEFKGLTHKHLFHYVGDQSLEESAAFFKTCDVFVTSSSGPQHLAAAIGVPCMSIMFEENARSWGPLAPQHRMVISDKHGDVRDISVDSVYEATLQSLQAATHAD